ncbi:MAG: cytochrome c-type biogenesis protein CcmH [Dyella sp.]
MLWFGPLLILLIGTVVVVVTIRKRARATSSAVTANVDHGDDW